MPSASHQLLSGCLWRKRGHLLGERRSFLSAARSSLIFVIPASCSAPVVFSWLLWQPKAPALSKPSQALPLVGSCGAGVEVWVPDENSARWSQWQCPDVGPAIQHVPAVREEGKCTKLPPACQGLAGSLLKSMWFFKVFSCHYYLPLTHRPRLVWRCGRSPASMLHLMYKLVEIFAAFQ